VTLTHLTDSVRCDFLSQSAGVTSDHWIAMGEAAGFVITDTANDLRKGLRTDPNAVRGYFMVRRGQAWMQVDPTAASSFYQTQLVR
jgi:hypothetical protein